MTEEDINADTASFLVKDYLNKIRFGNVEMSGRPLIEQMDFTITQVEEQEGVFIVKCELNQNLFDTKKIYYTFEVDKKGKIKKIKGEREKSS